MFTGCSMYETLNSEAISASLFVRGSTFDTSSQPIEDIMLVFTAFADEHRTHAIKRDTTYSRENGRFSFITPSLGNIYSITAYDTDGNDNGGLFKSQTIDINLSNTSPSYSTATGYYMLNGNLFFLEKAE